MKRFVAFLFSFVLLVSCAWGCHAPIDTPPVTVPDLEEMEVYRVLSGGISSDATLDELLDAFSEMCQVPMDVTCDMTFLKYPLMNTRDKAISYVSLHVNLRLPGISNSSMLDSR